MVYIPTKCGLRDSDGRYFCRWGSQGKKYYYSPGDDASKERARKKADKQGAAAYAHGYTGKDADNLSLDQLETMELEIENKKLPNVNPNESEQSYVSRCIEYETEASPDRPKDQIARMCYEKYRSATGTKKSQDEDKLKVPNPDEPGKEDEPGEEDNEEEELHKKSIDIPKSFEEIKENCFIIHKGKIAKIVKVLEK